MDIDYPQNTQSRFPTPNEIRAVLSGLVDYSVEENGSPEGDDWQVVIEHSSGPDDGPWTLLNVDDPQGADTPCDLAFEKGHPDLIADVLHRLTPRTGPLVLIPDTGDDPLLLHESCDLREALSSWGFMKDAE